LKIDAHLKTAPKPENKNYNHFTPISGQGSAPCHGLGHSSTLLEGYLVATVYANLLVPFTSTLAYGLFVLLFSASFIIDVVLIDRACASGGECFGRTIQAKWKGQEKHGH